MLKKILVVDDEKVLNDLLSGHLRNKEGYVVSNAYDGQEAIDIINNEDFDVVILDVFLQKKHGMDVLKHIMSLNKGTQVIMASGYMDTAMANEALKIGALGLLLKPFDMNKLKDLLLKAFTKRENYIKDKKSPKTILDVNFIGQSEIFKKTIVSALAAAKLNSPVLLLGQIGSGKHSFANFIHQNSNKKDGHFAEINCSDFSNALFERKLFGCEQGTQDIVSEEIGLVDEVNGGTLLLHEITDTPIEVQQKLLRFIESGEFKKVGGSKIQKASVRIIASSSKNIDEAVDNRMLRGDLYYHLSTTTIDIPPLKDHKEDIPLLVEYFLRGKDDSTSCKKVSNEAIQKLMAYDFPVNILELYNIIKHAELISSTDLISEEHIILTNNIEESKEETANEEVPSVNIKKEQIEEALKINKGNKIKTANSLGIPLKTLYMKLEEYKIT